MAEPILVSQDALSKRSERTLVILEFLSRYRTGQSSSEISRALFLPVNSVGRITETMHKRGWLYRREDDFRYMLTSLIADLTRLQVNHKSFVFCSWGSLKELCDVTDRHPNSW